MNLTELTINQAHQGLAAKEFSARELTAAYLERIKKLDGKIKAFITVDEKNALSLAETIDKKADFSSPLAGIPLAIKDLFCTQGLKSTGASKILENYIPPFDATAVARLKEQPAIILGKTNCDEFAQGASGENSSFFVTRNPWDIERVPGGSSSGSAAAVAAELAAYALGTDTGGSIRQPASFCGVTGLKVTYGRVSRYGVMAMTSSLDTIGPLTKNVEDAALVLEVIAGLDKHDSTTPPKNVDKYSEEINQDIKGLKIGLPKEYFIAGLDPEIKKIILAAADKFKELGAEIIEVSLPHTDSAIAVYYIICPSEVSTNMSRYDGVRYGFSDRRPESLKDRYLDTRRQGFGPEVKRRIMIGTYSLSAGYYDAYYNKAAQVRTLVKQDFDQAFEKVDIILTPTAPTPAFKVGENTNDPLKMYLADVFTVPASLAGICGLSIPAGFVDGLPVGLQLLGNRFDEKTILRAGHQYQQATDWHTRRPS
ncbi:MAG: aspartyl/glutamyl-tRNA amidotransferase subunit A [Candidatus Buchananbacteria bacterium RIFCSPLOWO2_01_FULL_46_12]|uniref:Glutamyl-tRNA(Gln) amidotransferase subunit A n=1 Tax=Candidatus Buchananbacteria bacterium RIFCSPLOWO2_01_FULL_46_12 TaxID=1797546 RepID=A0A1G1YN38_9BACT|nr:MAG: aspartyl/glutamyl-tRNA amidotransferase subunit A [Candidatus Buchananbacteria bacterium RIFCSPLOWO2_01_FULL_46_12]